MDQEVINLLRDYLDNGKTPLTHARERKIIFWYDEKQVYVDTIDELKDVFDNTELIKYNQNSFEIRHRIEVEETKKNFIIYCPFAEKKKAENPLLDLQSANQDFVFNPDQTTMWIKELGLSDLDREYVKDNQKFFKDKRRRAKFADFSGFESKSGININWIASAVLLGAKTGSKDDLFKRLFVEIYEKTKNGDDFLKFSNSAFMVDEINHYFGADLKSYDDLPNFFKSLIFTYFKGDLKDVSAFDGYGIYLLKKEQNAHIFIDSLMHDDTCKKSFEKLSRETYSNLEIKNALEKADLSAYIDSDAFEIIDQKIVAKLINELNSGVGKFDEYTETTKNRKNKYWYLNYEKVRDMYTCLENAILFLSNVEEATKSIRATDIDSLATIYSEKLYLIDTYYRKFYYYCDHISQNDELKVLANTIENKYVNDFTRELSIKWGNALSELEEYGGQKAILAGGFYDKYIKSFENGKPRAIVIISDAMRYEVAKELSEKLSSQGGTSKIEYMFGMIPSYTKLGMAALLPHKELRPVGESSDDILVDRKSSSSINDREKILQGKFTESFAIKYTDLMELPRGEWKTKFSGKKIVYIYHDEIDNTGEHNEGEIFDACEETVDHLADLVSQLDTTFSGVNCFVTADHGFYYKRSRNTNLSKTDKDSYATKQKKRYSFSRQKISEEGFISFNLDYAFGEDAGFVNVPRGDTVFSIQGLSSSYIHGGLMPQEIIVPVISYKISRGVGEADKVKISYSGLSTRITNSITNLKFAQNEAVDEKHRACRYTLHFEDADKNIVSNECVIIADSTAKDVNERRNLTEKFVFKNMTYDRAKPYFLIIRDEETGVEVDSLQFIIDIAITNNFNF